MLKRRVWDPRMNPVAHLGPKALGQVSRRRFRTQPRRKPGELDEGIDISFRRVTIFEDSPAALTHRHKTGRLFQKSSQVTLDICDFIRGMHKRDRIVG
jgi:hypothetical protein